MLKQALKAIARQNNFLYSSVFADFVAGNNPSCLFPGTPWRYVSFCHSCRHSICIPPKRKCCQMPLTATDGFQPRQLKKLLAANQCWTSLLDAGGLRDTKSALVNKVYSPPQWPPEAGGYKKIICHASNVFFFEWKNHLMGMIFITTVCGVISIYSHSNDYEVFVFAGLFTRQGS